MNVTGYFSPASCLFTLLMFFFCRQKIRRMLHPTPKWGPAHQIPKFDQTDIESGKSRIVTNPGFSARSNPFETRI